jgi:hypothetical protein
MSACGYAISVFGTACKTQNYISASGYVNVVSNKWRIRDPSGPRIRLYSRAPSLLTTLRDRPRKRYTLFYDQSLPSQASAHPFSSASLCITLWQLFLAFVRGFAPLFCLDSVPDASAVVADLVASVFAEIPAAIADLLAAITFAVISP